MRGIKLDKQEINQKIYKLLGQEPCTNKICSTKEIDYTRSFDACISALDVLGFTITDCDGSDGYCWSIISNGGDFGHTEYHQYPVYALAKTIASIDEV